MVGDRGGEEVVGDRGGEEVAGDGGGENRWGSELVDWDGKGKG
jgi:hypothetical protein